jgi:hypothetical protein
VRWNGKNARSMPYYIYTQSSILPEVFSWQNTPLKRTVCPGNFAVIPISKKLSSLLKNTLLLRYAHLLSLKRTVKYATFLRFSFFLQQDVINQLWEKTDFSKTCKVSFFSPNIFRQFAFFSSNVENLGYD